MNLNIDWYKYIFILSKQEIEQSINFILFDSHHPPLLSGLGTGIDSSFYEKKKSPKVEL